MAVVVDVIHNVGAIRIFEKDSDERVAAIGTKDAGNLVIVPWDSNWWLRASGSLKVAYIIENNK